MKKPGHHETRVTRGFIGSLVRSRLADFLNIRLFLMDAIRRFAARRQSPRVVERRTYVFILVPFDFRANGNARKTELEQDLIDNSRHADDPRTNGLFPNRRTFLHASLAFRDRCGSIKKPSGCPPLCI